MKKAKPKRKPAGDVTIRLGDLFNDLPEDLHTAAAGMATGMGDSMDPDKMTCEDTRRFARNIYTAMWARLLNEATRRANAGPKGPRLPAGVRFIALLPHLLEARNAHAARETTFEHWVKTHEWPAGMHPQTETVRRWLTRYKNQIKAYEPHTEENKDSDWQGWPPKVTRSNP